MDNIVADVAQQKQQIMKAHPCRDVFLFTQKIFWDNYSKSPWGLACLRFAYPWFKTYHFAHLRCLPLEICYPPFLLPLEKHIVREKKNIRKIKKVRAFYCLRTSFRTKHKSIVLLFSCPMGYSNIYWFEFVLWAVSLPKKQSPIYQRLPNISQSYQTKLLSLSLSLSL